MRTWKSAAAVALLVLPGVMPAQAASVYDKPSVGFTCVAATDCDPNISGQLSMQVIGDKNGEDPNVYFKVFNDVGVQSSVTQISFAGLSDVAFLHPLSGDATQGTGPGTQFALAFHGPGNSIADGLPAGNTIGFDSSWSAKAVSQGAGGNGQPANGIDASGEAFEMIASNPNHPNYLAFLSAIQSGNILVGLHITNFSDGGSASYVTAVPEPATMAAIAVGLLGMGAARLRRGA